MNYRRIYIPNSKVFITVVTNNRVQILKGREALLLSSIKDASNYYDFEVDCFSILHEHFHLILSMKNILDYPKIIHSIKYNFTKNAGVATPTYIKQGPLWQNRYFEHSIINEEDLYKHFDYIHYNPVKHGYVLKPLDWEYSSFKDFVKLGYYEKDWCNFEDKHKINNCSFE